MVITDNARLISPDDVSLDQISDQRVSVSHPYKASSVVQCPVGHLIVGPRDCRRWRMENQITTYSF